MKFYPERFGCEGKTFVYVTVDNIGTATTTITHFHGWCASNLWCRIRGDVPEAVELRR